MNNVPVKVPPQPPRFGGLFRLLSRKQPGARKTPTRRMQEAIAPALSPFDDVKVPRFILEQKLGEGGMASVYLARQESNGRLVAIKILARHLQNDPQCAEQFLTEAQRLAELSHPNIVPVFDWGTHDGVGYIVMEYMKGGSLAQRLQDHSLTLRDAINITRQIAAGLDFAAEKGYVHCDIKPENILFREDGSPCILDFGIARESAASTVSPTGITVGTGAYMSPEQAQPGRYPCDGRSDLYSLGIVLYELLTGYRPFEFRHLEPQQAFQHYVFAHVNSPPPPLPDRFAPFQWIMDQLLAKKPADRFNRGNDLRQVLTLLEAQLAEDYLSRLLQPTSSDLAPDRVSTGDKTLPANERDNTPFLGDVSLVANALNPTARSQTSNRPRRTSNLVAAALLSLAVTAVVGYLGYQQLQQVLVADTPATEMTAAVATAATALATTTTTQNANAQAATIQATTQPVKASASPTAAKQQRPPQRAPQRPIYSAEELERQLKVARQRERQIARDKAIQAKQKRRAEKRRLAALEEQRKNAIRAQRIKQKALARQKALELREQKILAKQARREEKLQLREKKRLAKLVRQNEAEKEDEQARLAKLANQSIQEDGGIE